MRVCVRWDLLWAEDKPLTEGKEKLKKPGRPDSIVRYPNCSHHLFDLIFTIISAVNAYFSSCVSVFDTFSLQLFILPNPSLSTCLFFPSLWLSFSCYALLHVCCVKSWCSPVWNPDRMLMFSSALLQLLTVGLNQYVCVCVCTWYMRMCAFLCFSVPGTSLLCFILGSVKERRSGISKATSVWMGMYVSVWQIFLYESACHVHLCMHMPSAWFFGGLPLGLSRTELGLWSFLLFIDNVLLVSNCCHILLLMPYDGDNLSLSVFVPEKDTAEKTAVYSIAVGKLVKLSICHIQCLLWSSSESFRAVRLSESSAGGICQEDALQATWPELLHLWAVWKNATLTYLSSISIWSVIDSEYIESHVGLLIV